jgi:hypothetical protein
MRHHVLKYVNVLEVVCVVANNFSKIVELILEPDDAPQSVKKATAAVEAFNKK